MKTRLENLKIKAFDLTIEITQIQDGLTAKANELERILEEIKKCQK
jgi:hypothetical protein